MELLTLLIIPAFLVYYAYERYLGHKEKIARIQAGLTEEDDDDQNT